MFMKLVKYLFVILIIVSFSSCETDFTTTADWEDITVVYGLLDQNDSVYYLKINKAFLGEGNALTYAQIKDSSEYPYQLNVQIEEWANGGNSLIQTIDFNSIEIDNKDDGVFYNPYQVVYKGHLTEPYEIAIDVTHPGFDTTYRKIWINTESRYKLKITNPVTGAEITAETNIVHDFDMTKPPAWGNTVKFDKDAQVPGSFEWEKAENGGKNEFLMKYKYRELMKNSTDTTDKSIILTMASFDAIVIGYDYFFTYWGYQFYNTCENLIPYEDQSVEDNVKARFDNGVDIIISVAENELSLFMEVYEPSTSIVQEKPLYTNIENGIGIFSGRYRKLYARKLHSDSFEDLKAMDLKFEYD